MTEIADNIVALIDKGFVGLRAKQKPRRYIGGSNIGGPCDAALGYSLRGFPDDEPAPKTQRIFALGHKLEDLIIEDLKRSGITVLDRDPETDWQFAYQKYGGHIRGNVDGQIEVADGELALLEIKSMNAAKWRAFVKKGVAESHPQYVAQMQTYMGLGGFEKAALLGYNKDTSEYHCEVVEFDLIEFHALMARAERIMGGHAPRVTDNEDDWRCKFCFKRGACREGRLPDKDCATCLHSLAQDDGRWYCTAKQETAQELCDEYSVWEPSAD
jgi:hypothetical protein